MSPYLRLGLPYERHGYVDQGVFHLPDPGLIGAAWTFEGLTAAGDPRVVQLALKFLF